MEEQTEQHTSEPYRFTPTSYGTEKVAAALTKAQAAFAAVPKGQTADAGSYSYDYADLASIMDMLREPLGANELALFHFTREATAGLMLETRLLHSSGQFLATEIPIIGTTPQGIGSALSYMRRYSVGALVGCVTQTDDDGAAAEAEAKPSPKKRAKAPLPKSKDGFVPLTKAEQKRADENKALAGWRASLNASFRAGGQVPEPKAQKEIVAQMVGAAGCESSRDLTSSQRAEILVEVDHLYGSPNTGQDATSAPF